MPARLLTAFAIAAFVIPGASAQPAAPSAGVATTNQQTFIRSQATADWRVSQLVGRAVFGPDNVKVGNIGDIVLDSTGNTRAVVIGVGGTLGSGDRNVAVPFNALTVVPSSGGDKIEKIAVKYTRIELKDAPNFVYRKTPIAAVPKY
jgi:sporulation protein YlmC with PRC-barrel domain